MTLIQRRNNVVCPVEACLSLAKNVRMIVGEYERIAIYKRYNVVDNGPDSVLETAGTIDRGNC